MHTSNLISELTLNSNFFPVAYFADIESSEVLCEVFERHPESAIITEFRIDCLNNLRSPTLLIIVTPLPLPFEGAPWVSNVDDLIAKCFFDLN